MNIDTLLVLVILVGILAIVLFHGHVMWHRGHEAKSREAATDYRTEMRWLKHRHEADRTTIDHYDKRMNQLKEELDMAQRECLRHAQRATELADKYEESTKRRTT